jgi:hypothetical protein
VEAKNQGFSLIETLFVTVTVGIIGFTGLYIWHSKQSTNKTLLSTSSESNNTNANSSNPYRGWKTFSNKDAKLTFQYPSNWQNVYSVEPLFNNAFAGIYGYLTSPSGHKLFWIEQNIGGGGADCNPTDDQSVATTYKLCPTKQIYSVVSTNKSLTLTGFEGEKLYITNTKFFTSGSEYDISYPEDNTLSNAQSLVFKSNSTNYQICLDAYTINISNPYAVPPSVGIKTGDSFPCTYQGNTGFNAMYTVANQTDFNSPEAQTVTLILNSFKGI